MDAGRFERDGHLDVGLIMEHVREEIRRRGVGELLSDEDVEERASARLLALAEEASVEPELLSHLLSGREEWNLTPEYRVETHRRGLSRFAVVFLKTLARPVVRLYTDALITRQAQLNHYLVALCRALARDSVRLEASQAALLRRLEDLERRTKTP